MVFNGVRQPHSDGMKTKLPTLVLVVALFPFASHALEAVAQGDVGSGSAMAGSMGALQSRIDALQAYQTAAAAIVKQLIQQVSHTMLDVQQLQKQAADGANGTPPEIPACTSTQILTSRDGRTLQCVSAIPQLSCRTVEAKGAAPTYWAMAKCDANEFVMNGGGKTHPDWCGGPRGFLHDTYPDLATNSWVADAFGAYQEAEACSIAYATCCKFIGR